MVVHMYGHICVSIYVRSYVCLWVSSDLCTHFGGVARAVCDNVNLLIVAHLGWQHTAAGNINLYPRNNVHIGAFIYERTYMNAPIWTHLYERTYMNTPICINQGVISLLCVGASLLNDKHMGDRYVLAYIITLMKNTDLPHILWYFITLHYYNI